MQNIYFVYIYKNPVTLQPFYVGYGKNDRHLSHLQEAIRKPESKQGEHKLNTIRKLLATNLEPIIELQQTNLSSINAQELEITLIAKFGRTCDGSGILTNVTRGGTGGSTFHGRTHSLESKTKMREVKLGKTFTESHKNKLSETAKTKVGDKNNFFGKTHTDKSKSKMSESLTGKIRSPEFKNNLSVMLKGTEKPKVKCPHCSVEGGKPVMMRYHFDKCKSVNSAND